MQHALPGGGVEGAVVLAPGVEDDADVDLAGVLGSVAGPLAGGARQGQGRDQGEEQRATVLPFMVAPGGYPSAPAKARRGRGKPTSPRERGEKTTTELAESPRLVMGLPSPGGTADL